MRDVQRRAVGRQRLRQVLRDPEVDVAPLELRVALKSCVYMAAPSPGLVPTTENPHTRAESRSSATRKAAGLRRSKFMAMAALM